MYVVCGWRLLQLKSTVAGTAWLSPVMYRCCSDVMNVHAFHITITNVMSAKARVSLTGVKVGAYADVCAYLCRFPCN